MSDFSELEDQLRKLRPTQPSPELATRIERALAEPEATIPAAGVLTRERRVQFNWLSAGLSVAAATALVLFVFVRFYEAPKRSTAIASTKTPLPAVSSNAELVPAGLTQVVYHTRDEGVHFGNNSDQPMRRVRSHTRDTLQWRNPKTGATLRISYPTEQVSLQPVSSQ
jgi:hypothetical protein